MCSNVDAKYGDVVGGVDGVNGSCGPNGDVNLFDIIAILNAFAGDYPEGCDPVNMDIAGNEGSCEPNGSLDLSDILAVLNAFQGDDNCCSVVR